MNSKDQQNLHSTSKNLSKQLNNSKSSNKKSSGKRTGNQLSIEVPKKLKESIMQQNNVLDNDEIDLDNNSSIGLEDNLDTRQNESARNQNSPPRIPDIIASSLNQFESVNRFQDQDDDPDLLGETSSCQSNDKKVRVRSVISDDVSAVLKLHFQCNPKPNREEIIELSQKLNHRPRVLKVWFQNMRAKKRRFQNSLTNNESKQFNNSLNNLDQYSGLPNLNGDQNSILLNQSSNSNDTSSLFFQAGNLFGDVNQLYSSALANGNGQSVLNSLSSLNALNASANGNLLNNNSTDLVRPLNLPYTSSALSAAALLNNQLANLQASLRSNSSSNYSPLLNSNASLSANCSPVSSLNSKASSSNSKNNSRSNKASIHPLLNKLTSLNNLLTGQLSNDVLNSSDHSDHTLDNENEDDYEEDLHNLQQNLIKNGTSSPNLKNDLRKDQSANGGEQPLDFSFKKSTTPTKNKTNGRKRKRISDQDDSNEFNDFKRFKNLDLSLLNDKELSFLFQQSNNNNAMNGINKLDLTSSLIMKNLLNNDSTTTNSLFTNGLLNGQNFLTNPLLTNGLLNGGANNLFDTNNLLNSLNGNLLNDSGACDASEQLIRSLLLQNQAQQLLNADLTNEEDLDVQLEQANIKGMF